MARFANSVLFLPASGGTTDFIVSSAIQGYMTPALAGAVTGVYKYRAESADLSQWEIGEGTYTSGTTTLTRTTVLYNSAGSGTATGQSGAGTKINFSAPPRVGVVQAVQDTLEIENTGSFTTGQKSQARTNIGMADGHIPGEPSNAAAASGEVGEYIEAAGAVSLTTTVVANAGTLVLPAGDWDITVSAFMSGGGSTSLTNYLLSISTVSATHNTATNDRFDQFRNAGGITDPFLTSHIGPLQQKLSGSTTFYLVASATFTNALSVSSAKIRARRVR